MLAQYGALVTTVDSARVALDEIDQRPSDVVLSDTAYASVADCAAALESGYQAHVAKPFDPAELARTIAGVHREHLSTS
jgi:CheY-like chemotaxis protein